MLRPIAYGLVLGLIGMNMATGWAHPLTGLGAALDTAGRNFPMLDHLLIGVVLLAVVRELSRRAQAAVSLEVSAWILIATLALIAVSTKASGVAVGVCIVLLGYGHGNRMLFWLGTAALLTYLSGYYYMLNATLLVKAQSLAAIGVTLLLLRWLVLLRLAPKAEAEPEPEPKSNGGGEEDE